MSTDADEPIPDLDSYYDDSSGSGLTCLVCGALVAPHDGFPRVHWDWHEASNGA